MTPQTNPKLFDAIARREDIRTAAGKRPISAIIDGDSWAKKPFGDLGDSLEKLWAGVFNIASPGHTLHRIAWADPNQYDEMVRAFAKLVDSGNAPQVVVLSGGGNDAKDAFSNILNHLRDTSAPEPCEPGIVKGNFERMRRAVFYVCEMYEHLAGHYLGREIPIIVHGYDRIRRLGKPFHVGPIDLVGPWISPVLAAEGYGDLPVEDQLAIITEVMDLWNEELYALERQIPNLHFVDLRGTLTRDDQWADEMHPTGDGFDLLAEKIDARAVEVIE